MRTKAAGRRRRRSSLRRRGRRDGAGVGDSLSSESLIVLMNGRRDSGVDVERSRPREGKIKDSVTFLTPYTMRIDPIQLLYAFICNITPLKSDSRRYEYTGPSKPAVEGSGC
jgi:hypothetical protein